MACATGPTTPLVIGVIGQLIAHTDARLVAVGVRQSWEVSHGAGPFDGMLCRCLQELGRDVSKNPARMMAL